MPDPTLTVMSGVAWACTLNAFVGVMYPSVNPIDANRASSAVVSVTAAPAASVRAPTTLTDMVGVA
ncbi:MAG: hypothetical protein M3460_04510 [Actinomycetota bacterium]|nr:hypothetical protein [Actinomycetota bacterium]